MKKTFFASLLLMAAMQTVNAQKVVLHMAGNQTFECNISKLDSITFVDDGFIIVDEHEWVDLGLPSGTLWATCNVGANSPEEYGDYFAWGETKPKDDYSWETYKYYQGSYSTMIKYCTNRNYGTVDNKTELEPEDDVATQNWGNGWEIPSAEQFEELIHNSYTVAEWTTINGVNGRKITSRNNGNYLFLPVAGYIYDTSFYKTGDYDIMLGGYWSSSLYANDPIYAQILFFCSDGIYMSNDYRCYGLSIRPVRVKTR